LRLDKLRIVHAFRAPLGGLFRHVIDLACEQAARGHEVGMFFDSGGMCERVEAALARIPGGPKLGVRTCPISRDPGPGDIAAFLKFSGWLREVRPDVVHGHGSKGGAIARMAARSAIPTDPIRAYTPHGGSFNYRTGSLAHRAYMAAELFMAYRTDLFLFESDDVRRRYERFVGAKAGIRRVVVNGLAEAEFEPVAPAPDAADILYVGELRAAKGIDTLLEALSLAARARGATPSAVFFGSGPDRPKLIQQAAELGLADHVKFPGPTPIRAAFARGRIMVVPSRAESMPYVVLEAAAAGVPMVATNVGGIPEIFGPYADRLGPCDDPKNLASRIVALLDMPASDRAARAAELARFVKDNFSIHTMTNSVLASYREAMLARHDGTVAAPAAAHTAS
jgi:glycosyltransferase involved in cell wall biosynthesis